MNSIISYLFIDAVDNKYIDFTSQYTISEIQQILNEKYPDIALTDQCIKNYLSIKTELKEPHVQSSEPTISDKISRLSAKHKTEITLYIIDTLTCSSKTVDSYIEKARNDRTIVIYIITTNPDYKYLSGPLKRNILLFESTDRNDFIIQMTWTIHDLINDTTNIIKKCTLVSMNKKINYITTLIEKYYKISATLSSTE
jgi:hypothetical protein